MCCRWILFINFYIVGLIGIYGQDKIVSSIRGTEVTLLCPIDVTTCGELHSVKWFKGNERIAVVSGDGAIANVEGQLSDRMSIDHSPLGPATRIHIRHVQVSDEDNYLCEITYLDPLETCDNSGAYSIALNILVPPAAILLLDEEDNEIRNATMLGPLREGHTLGGICLVKSTRPVPHVGWYRAGKKLQDLVTTEEANGLFSVKSVLSLILTRQELGAFIECRVESPALQEIVSNQINLDLQVRPTKINLSGVKHHTVQGTKVTLQCQVTGARPAANITWYNSSRPLNQEKETLSKFTKSTYEQNDGSFETISDMIFTATRHENGATFKCEADNVVMRDDLDKPIHDSFVLEVMYPPVVTVKPENVTVNETQDVLLFCEYEANPNSLENVKWLRDGQPLNLSDKRYEGGNPEQTALLVKNASRYDIGMYRCQLSNAIGSDTSDNSVNVDVLFVPIVEITMEPESPIIEDNESNVTLVCNVVQGNPFVLLKVRWFLDGQILKELPECESNPNNEDELCEIDPSKMLLQNVGRDFYGNYSCEGYNSAGWGLRSKESVLVVYFEPGNATLIYSPTIPLKRKSVTLTCSVEDGGNPAATRYRWLRGGKPVMDVVTATWTVDPVGLDSRTNFSCYAYNEGGDGNSALIQLDVHAPPAFIQKLQPYTGVLYSTPGISLSCRIECVPACNISWFKDGIGIDETNERYSIRSSYLDAEPSTGDLESVFSVLSFNMSAWPEEKLDIFKDNANYSCVSTNNSVGPGVRSTTFFGVEYPPENTTVSNFKISVIEGSIPPRVLCSSKAYPEPSFDWKRLGEIAAKGLALIVNKPMQRSDSGIYSCTAFNKHGEQHVDMQMNILFKPNCSITRREIKDEDTLICTANGNPQEYDFTWSYKSENDTQEIWEDHKYETTSHLVLNDFDKQRIYRCVANNSVGAGSFCEYEVAGLIPWWRRWDRLTLYILIGAIAALLLAVIIVCIIIICICRKRRQQNKYQMSMSIGSRQSEMNDTTSAVNEISQPPPRPPLPSQKKMDGRETAAATALEEYFPRLTEISKSPPKWPLRPGVMVHLRSDTKNNLCAARAQSPLSPNTSRITNVSYASPTKNDPSANASSSPVVAPLPPPPLPARNSAKIPKFVKLTVEENSRDELRFFSNSNIVRCLKNRFRWRRNMPPPTNSRNKNGGITSDQENSNGARGFLIFSRGIKRCQFRQNRLFDSGKSVKSSTGLFEHNDRHQERIECNDGVVTYKRANNYARRPISGIFPTTTFENEAGPNLMQNTTSTFKTPVQVDSDAVSRKRKVDGITVQDKLSVDVDPLTETGEYENLPFHNMQPAPNKPYITTTSQHSNVVRVAPRPKNPSNYHLTDSPNIGNTNIIANTNSNIHSKNNLQIMNKYQSNLYPNISNFPIQCFNYKNYQPTTVTTMPSTNSASFVNKNNNNNNSFINNSNTNKMNNNNNANTNKVSISTGAHLNINPFLIKSHNNTNGTDTSDNEILNTQNNIQTNNNNNKKFNSLKSLGIKKSPQFYSMRVNKCKRHHSYIEPQKLILDNTSLKSLQLSNNIQPLYENLTDSIQIHETSLHSESEFDTILKNYNDMQFQQHHQYQSKHKMHQAKHHQPKNNPLNHHNNDLLYHERISIYRSDSGISNSSYECITPIPAPRTNSSHHSNSANNNHILNNIIHNNNSISNIDYNTSKSSSSSIAIANNNNCKSVPVYMNIPLPKKSFSLSGNKTNGFFPISNRQHKANNVITTNTATALHQYELSPNNNNANKNLFESSTKVRRTQQILMPTELFPCTALTSAGINGSQSSSSSSSGISQSMSKRRLHVNKSSRELSQSSSSTSSISRRPIKLPLRKHHSFHFQSSQTVAGVQHTQITSKKHNSNSSNMPNNFNSNLKIMSSTALIASSTTTTTAVNCPTTGSAVTAPMNKNNGPLIFRQFSSDQSAFKPITSVPQSPSSTSSSTASTSSSIAMKSQILIKPNNKKNMSNTGDTNNANVVKSNQHHHHLHHHNQYNHSGHTGAENVEGTDNLDNLSVASGCNNLKYNSDGSDINTSNDNISSSDNSNNTISNNKQDSVLTKSLPRICGTNIKRHTSNIETTLTNSVSDIHTIQQFNQQQLQHPHRQHQKETLASETVRNTEGTVNENMGNGAISCDKTSGGNSVYGAKRIVYADLLMPEVTDVNQHQEQQQPAEKITLSYLPKRTTQYATLKFNEVNI